MQNAFKLHLEDGTGARRVFAFEQNKVVVGRDPASDLVIDDVEISRSHLVLTREKGAFMVEDKHSTNGTFLGGKQIRKKTEIGHADQLVLGQHFTLRLEVIEPEPEAAQSAVAQAADEFEPLPEADAAPDAAQMAPVVDAYREEPVPVAKVDEYITEDETVLPEPSKKARPAAAERPKWVVILLAALVFIVVFCVIPLIVIEATNQWCDLFAGFFNAMSPGVCP
jgi:predicted component of type VI protein secretion system